MGSTLEKNSAQVRKRIEGHTFSDEGGEEYGGSEFNGFSDYFRRKKIKLQNLDAETRSASDKPQIFKGIVAHVSGYTQPSLHILHREIVEHGGGFLQYLDSKTMATHIIASTLPPKKSVDFSRYRIVKPTWIMDSISAGKLLPWADYRVLDEGPRQKVLKFDDDKGLSQSNPQARQRYREQTDNSFYTHQMKAPTLPSQGLGQVAEKLHTPTRAYAKTSPNLPVPMDMDDPTVLQSESTGATNILKLEDASPQLQSFRQSRDSANETDPASILEPPQNVTPEEHNAWLLSDPRLRKSSTANPDFLQQFYSESRLHHLSTWKAELKSKMQRLATEKGLLSKQIPKRPGLRRYIMHVDFDSFFCAVSLKQHPDYVDKPAAVAHSTGSGSEIASCNYPAREFGVKNGMWMKRAKELCADLKVLPYDFPAYEDASRLFYESILSVGGVVQSVSVDEALVDVTSIVLADCGSNGIGIDEGSIWREQEKADKIALTLRESIKARTGCAVSVGIGGNILQAKVALRRAKPAGQYQLKPEDAIDMIGALKVDGLPGVAYSTGGKLEEIGVKFVKDIRDISKERLTSILGPKTSEKLRDYSRGIDRTEVGEQSARKSVSAEVSWGIRFISQQEAEEFVYSLCKELEKRLVNEQLKGKHLTMKIMRRCLDSPLDPAKHLGHGKCDVFNKGAAFGVATHSFEAIGKEAVSILRSYKFSPGDLRGLGVQMTKLEPMKSTLGTAESSQRRLMFHAPAGNSPARAQPKAGREPIMESESPRAVGKSETHGDARDPITDDPLTPRKIKVHPAMALARAGQDDAESRTPLNVSGTQFIIPSNADPSILAELPSDIRSKLMAQRSGFVADRPGSPSNRSTSENVTASDIIPSQVDVEVFNALPDDMKAEVLATYGRKPSSVILQQSPRKDHSRSRKQSTPTKRGGIRNMLGKGSRQRDAQSGLMQTNFKAQRTASEPPEEEDVQELDPEFLAELPEDVRKEVIADHRRRRLAQLSRLDAPAPRHHGTDEERILEGGQRMIQFPAPPPAISFARSGVSSTREVKDMLDAWHAETEEDGPHRGDVDVLEKYLIRVVEEERDLEKATAMVKWLDLIVEQDGAKSRGQQEWKRAVKGIKDAVQGAVKRRGLAPLNI